MKNLKILCLNCQKAYNPNIKQFLQKILESNFYDFLLLQEANEKIIPIIRGLGQYNILSAMNPDNQIESHLRILYRNRFVLKDKSLLSFSKMNRSFALRGELGFLLGTFDCDGETIMLGSLHLHPGFPFHLRMKETNIVKKHIQNYGGLKNPVIFGGDLNLAYPWENWLTRKYFSRNFIDATINTGPTLDGLYTEKGTHLASKIGNMLTTLGISVKFKTDKLFVGKNIAGQNKITTRVLPDRVSDHSPIELIIYQNNL